MGVLIRDPIVLKACNTTGHLTRINSVLLLFPFTPKMLIMHKEPVNLETLQPFKQQKQVKYIMSPIIMLYIDVTGNFHLWSIFSFFFCLHLVQGLPEFGSEGSNVVAPRSIIWSLGIKKRTGQGAELVTVW